MFNSVPMSSTASVISHPVAREAYNGCYGQTHLHIDTVNMTSGRSHRGGNGSKETEMSPGLTATGGNGVQGYIPNLFTFLSGTTTIEILLFSCRIKFWWQASNIWVTCLLARTKFSYIKLPSTNRTKYFSQHAKMNIKPHRHLTNKLLN